MINSISPEPIRQGFTQAAVGMPQKEESPASSSDSVKISSNKDSETLQIIPSKIEAGHKTPASFKEKVIKFAKQGFETCEDLIHSIKAFPGFIYPTVAGATEAEKAFVYSTLDSLPLKDASSVSHVQFFDKLTLLYDRTQEASGMAIPLPGGNLVGLSKNSVSSMDDWAKEVIIHETGHAKDYTEGFLSVIDKAGKHIWGKGPHVSEYSKNNMLEDFAESYAKYHTDPELLKSQCPEKYAEIERLEKAGALEGLIESNSAFRKTGRFIGEQLSKMPYLKQGLSIAADGYNVYSMVKGNKTLREGLKTGDDLKQMDGSMQFMSSACYTSKIFAVGGLAIDGAHQALSQAVKNKEITAQEANYIASHTVGAPARELVKIGKWINKTVHKITGKPYNDETLPDKKADTIKFKDARKAAAIAAGGAIGSVSGSMLGIYGGVTVGFAIGGPIGGVIGLVVGGVLGNNIMTKLGSKLGLKFGNLIQNNSKH